jgi:exonuclease III
MIEDTMLNIVSWNINYRFVDNFVSFINKYKNPDIFMIQEGICNSRVKFNDCEKLNNINTKIQPYGYTLLYNNCKRPKTSYLVKTTLLSEFNVINNIICSELIKSRVIVGKINGIIIINIYAPCGKYRPETETETFVNELNTYINKIKKIYGNNLIIGGDFNTILHDFENCNYLPNVNFLKLINKYKLIDIYKIYKGDNELINLSNLIKDNIKKVSPLYASVRNYGYVKIDYILMNFVHSYINNGIYEDTCGSDHRPLWLDIIV